ncbi:helix-turn-helix domain-containing protein [Paenibacillus xylanilyticus]|uniref:helix-turn-helix domain-containing protein n=1 Tax=Paenibacillus xylanilyticus TaxID=248903 RepID=UPI0039A0529D
MDYFKSKLFLKYIWSYLFILLIPLAFMTVFIYENAVKTLRTEIESSRLAQLSQTKVTIDSRMKELSEIASRISYDNRLSSYRVTNTQTSPEAIRALDQYKATSSMIDEIYLYFHDDKRIYSSKGLTDFEVFADNLSFESWDKQSLYNDLNETKYPTVRPADVVTKTGGVRDRKLAYLIPITPNSLNPHATVMVFIKESQITDLIDSILGNYQGLTFVLDVEGQILAANHQGDTLSTNASAALFNTITPGIQERRLDGKDHSIVSVQSESNGWTYMTVMPSSQFFSSVLDVRSFMMLIIGIVVLVGVAVALVLARMQYQPISTLVEFASSRFPEKKNAGEPGYANELERIRSALQNYSSRIDLQEPFARNQYLSTLINFGNSDPLSPELMQLFDLKLDKDTLFVMVIGWNGSKHSDMELRRRIASSLAHIELPDLQATGYGVELPQLDQFGVIMSFDAIEELDEISSIKQIMEHVRGMLLDTLSIAPMIAAGSGYRHLHELNQSYIEACSAFDLLVPGEYGSSALFEEMSKTPSHSFWIPNHMQLKLAQSLKQGNSDVASQMIRSSVSSLQSSMLPALLVRCISFDLLNTILKTASELGEHHMLQQIAPNMVFSSSLEELESVLLSLASQLCAEVNQDTQQEEQTLIDRIVDYIDTHFTDHNLSLDTLAYEFEVSPSHVSRSFKEKTGINFIQYIWQKRLDRVFHQLQTTDTPLKDLIQEVGYLDTPNFIRKFKKETGLTPGQYRKLHRTTTNDAGADSAS